MYRQQKLSRPCNRQRRITYTMEEVSVGILSHFLHCIHCSAGSSRSDAAFPDAPKRLMLNRMLTSRLATVKVRGIALSNGNCIATLLPTDRKHRRRPTVNFITRISAYPSISNGSIGPSIVSCTNNSVMLPRTALARTRFPYLGGCINRQLIAASNGALLNNSSGTNITRVVGTYTRLLTRPRMSRQTITIYFAPSRRVNYKTSHFPCSHFTTGRTCAISNNRLNRVRCRGFGTTSTIIYVAKIGVRPNSTLSLVRVSRPPERDPV